MTRAPRPWVFCLFLTGMTFAVYWPAVTHGFLQFDDDRYVTENALVQRGITWDGLRWCFTRQSTEGWPHPLAYVSHMLDVELFGLNAAGHHFTSVLLHVFAVILLFLAFLKMTSDPWKSSFVAAVFALHPLQVESVAWIAERKNVLNGFFFMLTLWLYARYAAKKSAQNYGFVCCAFVLSLLAKSVVVSLPLILLLIDFWPLKRREGPRRLLWEKLPLLALSGLCALRALVSAKSISTSLPFSMRAANALVSCCAYVGAALWPAGLCPFYPYPKEIAAWKWVAAAAFLAATTVAAGLQAKRRPWFFVGWFWFLAALAPMAGLVQAGGAAMADRYMYIPLVGLAIIAAWGLPELLGLGERSWILGAAGVVCAMMVSSGLQLRYWRDGITLFTRVVELEPASALAHDNLGVALYERGDLEEAVSEYRQAAALEPNYPEAHNNLAMALIARGQPVEAQKELIAALKADPSSAKAAENLEKVSRILAAAKAAPPQRPRPTPLPRK